MVFTINANSFLNVPGYLFSYWVCEKQLQLIGSSTKIKDWCKYTGSLNKTGDNDKFLRYHWEIDKNKINKTWLPYNKGGRFRKWYGNNDLIINVDEHSLEFYKNNKTSNLLSESFWHGPGITWTALTSGLFNGRYFDGLALSDFKGASIFPNKINAFKLLGYINSSSFNFYANIIAPTLDYNIGQIINVPCLPFDNFESYVEKIAEQNVSICMTEWDSFETSWDFKKHPLI